MLILKIIIMKKIKQLLEITTIFSNNIIMSFHIKIIMLFHLMTNV